MPTKKQRTAALRKANDEYYRKLGWKPGKKSSPHSIPKYTVESTCAPTSDRVPATGPRGRANRYTGTELAGIATMHKSNSVPVRKDNKEHAQDLAKMRRN